MSNFLQRIARLAVQPQNHLHPMLGSVYAPTAPSPAYDLSGSEISVPSPAESTRAAFRTGSEPARVGDERHQSRPLEPHLSAQTSGLSALLFPDYSANEPVSSGPGATENRLRRAENTFGVDRSEVVSEGIPMKVVERSEPGALPPVSARQTGLHPHVPLTTPTAVRRSADQMSQRNLSAQGEADEIHIHIGRIEVTSIAQPIGRSASAPASRKSINLGDYLQGGNGRSR